MIEHDTGAAVVLEDGELAGVISERDLLRVLSEGFDTSPHVSDRMVRHVLTATPQTTLPEAMAVMVDGHFRHLPVVERGPRRRHGLDARPDGLGQPAPSPRRRRGRRVDTAELVATINRMRTGAN